MAIFGDHSLMEAFAREHARRAPSDYHRNIQLFNSAVRLAMKFGTLPPKDPLEGLEDKIEFHRRLRAPVRAPAGDDREDAGAG